MTKEQLKDLGRWASERVDTLVRQARDQRRLLARMIRKVTGAAALISVRKGLNFAEALEAMKGGHAVRRTSWSKHTFIFLDSQGNLWENHPKFGTRRASVLFDSAQERDWEVSSK